MACRESDKATGACLKRAVVVVHETMESYKQYLSDLRNEQDTKQPPEQLGKKIFTAQCTSCHTDDGRPLIGPTMKGNYGTPRKMSDGSEVVMDENYIRESLDTPNAKIRAGFAPAMTPFAGRLTENQIKALIAYIQSLK